MKRISHLLLLSIFLTSCANAVTSAPVVTETSTPTQTSLAPTADAPIETPDPFKGMPDGTNRVENGVPYLDKTENGKTNTFIWTEKTDALTGEVVFSEWTREITDGKGIPIFDWARSDFKDDGIIQVFVSDKNLDGTNLPLFIHTNKTMDNLNDSDLKSTAQVSLYKRTHNGNNPNEEEMGAFIMEIVNGEVSVDFFTVNSSKIQIWNISSDHGTKVFITDWDSLEGEPDITNNPIGISLRSKILGVDTDGNLMGVIATNVPLDTLTEEQWWEIILWHSASVIDRPDQTKQFFNSTLSGWLAAADNKNPNTWIEQVPNN